MISNPKEYSLYMGTLVDLVIQFLLCRLAVGTVMIISDMGMIKVKFFISNHHTVTHISFFFIKSQISHMVKILIACLFLIFAWLIYIKVDY